jgi:hypothetical protein
MLAVLAPAHSGSLSCSAQVRQYALATALAKYGAMAGPGQIGPSILTVDMLVGSGSELVRQSRFPPLWSSFVMQPLMAGVSA